LPEALLGALDVVLDTGAREVLREMLELAPETTLELTFGATKEPELDDGWLDPGWFGPTLVFELTAEALPNEGVTALAVESESLFEAELWMF
jgi:hypothetical protein